MSELNSQFTRDDIETLIESMGDWEMVGNQEFHILQMIKSAPMPPEDHEAYEAWSQIKEQFKNREKQIMASRVVRQEKAVFLKAKLMLVRKDLGVATLFDMAGNSDPNSPMPTPKVLDDTDDLLASSPKATGKKKAAAKGEIEEWQHRLELAEFFIKDLGVEDHYRKFLEERKVEKNSSN